MKSLISISTFLVLTSPIFAHTEALPQLPEEGFRLDLNAGLSYRSESLVKSSEAWVIPGVMMGGEALPSQKGLSLDEAFLTPAFQHRRVYGFLKLGRHLGSDSFELDHVLLGYTPFDSAFIEFGKMAAAFTPYNGVHATETNFSSRRLIYDAMWGGQFNDEGLRLRTLQGDWELGFELWKGRSFPAKNLDTDRSAADVYARYRYTEDQFKLELGVYGFQSDAKSREDNRYAVGHSHGGSTITLDPTYFDGRVKASGFHYKASHTYENGLSIYLQGEASQMSQDGYIWDLTHRAEIQNQLRGFWTELLLTLGKDTLSYRGERLQIQNDIYGASATILGQKLALTSLTQDPYRHSLCYERRLDDGFKARIEWSKDFTTRDKKDLLTLGLVVSETLFQSATKED